jgi:hypothetical protein
MHGFTIPKQRVGYGRKTYTIEGPYPGENPIWIVYEGPKAIPSKQLSIEPSAAAAREFCRRHSGHPRPDFPG